MRHAISYVSTAHKDLQEQELKNIMTKAKKFNNEHDITGILLHNERNFFQLIEGEKGIIFNLYQKILEDSRHHNIIQFLGKSVSIPSFGGYLTDFITDTEKHDECKLDYYLQYIRVLNPESQKALKSVMQLMMV